MANGRRTIARDSVFRGIGAASEPSPRKTAKGIGTLQTAVWLGEAEIEWLDQRCHEIRRTGWRGVTRSALIRALIRRAVEQIPELVGVSDESELKARLAASAPNRG